MNIYINGKKADLFKLITSKKESEKELGRVAWGIINHMREEDRKLVQITHNGAIIKVAEEA